MWGTNIWGAWTDGCNPYRRRGIRVTVSGCFNFLDQLDGLSDRVLRPKKPGRPKKRAGERVELRSLSLGSLNYQHTDSSRVVVSVAGGDAPLELNRGTSSPTRRYITVRGGTALSLTAESNNPSGTGLRVYGEYSQASTNALSSSSVMTIAAPYVAISGGAAPYGTGTVMGTMANGQAVVAMGDLEIPITMDRLVYPLPNPTTAPWTKWTEFQWLPDPGFYVYSVTSPDATDQNPNPTGSAETRPMKILTLNDAECLDDCDLNEHGNAKLINAKRYYMGPRANNPNGELVGLRPVTHPGHVFKGFDISGTDNVWLAEDEEVDDFYSLSDITGPATKNGDGLYMCEETEPLYIEMSESVSVTPVFEGPPELYWFCRALCLPQKRTTIGIGEEVSVHALGSDGQIYGQSVRWDIEGIGAKSISPSYGKNAIFTAAKVVGPASATVFAYDGDCVVAELHFTVLSPTGEATVHDSDDSPWQSGSEALSARTIFEVTVLPNTVCFGNIQIDEEDDEVSSPWPNEGMGDWSTSSGSTFDVECDNTFLDYFTEDLALKWNFFIDDTDSYVDFNALFSFRNRFPTDSGTWVYYADVETWVEYKPSFYFMTRHKRNGVSGDWVGPWRYW